MQYVMLALLVIGGSTVSTSQSLAIAPAYLEPVVVQGPPSEPTVEDEVVEVNNSVYCSCIQTARLFGLNLPRGDAKDLMPNSPPIEGGGVLLSYHSGTVQHVAYIQSILPEGLWIQEGNFHKCEYSERFIPWNSPHIRGFVAF